MNFDLTPDQREIKRTAREFLAARYTPEKIRAIALDSQPDPHWDEIVELGWPDIAEYGIVELAVVAEELGYALAPSPLAAHWAAKLLHPGLEGRGTVSLYDGIAVPNADVADTIIVKDGDRVLAVRAADATIEPAPALDATRPLFTVSFEGGEALSGDFERAWHAIAVMAAAESVGVAARVTGMAVEYAKERKQFGRAIGSYQAVKHELVEILRRLENARSLMYYAGWAWQDRPDELALATAAFRTAAGGAVDHATRAQISVHGGIGATWEHDAPLYFRRAQLSRRLLGGTAGASARVADELFAAAA
jgi:alkylation response protein AidB-like acyl-CoA dehydrogenase